MAFIPPPRDPRLVPIEPYYPQGELAILREEKRELKKQLGKNV